MDVRAAKDALRDSEGGARRDWAEYRALRLGVEAVAMPPPLEANDLRGDRERARVVDVVVEVMVARAPGILRDPVR